MSEQPVRRVRWREMATATGVTVPPSNGQIHVPDGGEEYLRNLFHVPTRPDVAFPTLSTDYEIGEDMRERAIREISVRRGQGQFRDALIDAYDSSCAITGSRVLAVLEAAHIDRYYGEHSNHVSNGLLLRADIHSLFDLRRITIDGDYRIHVADTLLETEYGQYDGAALRMPNDPARRPDRDALRRHSDGPA